MLNIRYLIFTPKVVNFFLFGENQFNSSCDAISENASYRSVFNVYPSKL